MICSAGRLMGNREGTPRLSGLVALLSSYIAGILALSSCAPSGTAEIDSFSRAVASQKKEDAQAFIKEHRSSPLVGDLIELLQPDVALEVCSSMPSGVSRHARRACQQLQEADAADSAVGHSQPPLPPRPPHLDVPLPPTKPALGKVGTT